MIIKWYCGRGRKSFNGLSNVALLFRRELVTPVFKSFPPYFPSWKVTSLMTQPLQINTHVWNIDRFKSFVCVSRIIPSSCSTTMGTRRWCPCGFAAVWRRGELRATPDATAGHRQAWGASLQGELRLRCCKHGLRNHYTLKLYVSNSSIKCGCSVVWSQEGLRTIWSRLSPSSKVLRASRWSQDWAELLRFSPVGWCVSSHD